MGAIDGRSEILADLGASFCDEGAIEFAIAFGSQVAGKSRPSSDLDLAVKFTDDLSSRERFEKRCFLSGDLQREGAPFIDISDIEDLPIAVAHDAVNGEFLCGDERAFRRFKTKIERAFEDRRDEIRDHQRGVIDRIAEGGLRG